MTETIISPVSKSLLKSELTEEKQLRITNKSNNKIYIVDYHNSPNVLREIGRQREEAFRLAGGGTGKALDLDEFDTMENCYKQLVVWNPDAEEIIGGYRYKLGTDVDFLDNGQPKLATGHLFRFSKDFIDNYLPYTIELARSYVNVDYQSTKKGAKSLFALDNLWDGLGALTVIMKDVKYFFGKVTMYPSYIRKGRDMILYFLHKYFSDREELIRPLVPLLRETPDSDFEALFNGKTFKDNYKILNKQIRDLGYNIPPLINSYMSLSPTMKMFGTAVNNMFGNVEETGILISVDEIFEEKRIRHIDTFALNNPDSVYLTSGANNVIYKANKEK